MKQTYQEVRDAIIFLKNWIEMDLQEISDDTTSDYAKFILSNHKHINVAIESLEDIINPTRGYGE